MERSKLSGSLRLLSIGQLVGLVSALGLLASTNLLLIQVLSDRPAHSMALLRFHMILMIAATIGVIVGAVINLVAQVKLWGEHADYRLALILSLTGWGVNALLILLKQDGFLPELLQLVITCVSLYLIVRATNEFLAVRGCDGLARRGWTMLMIYFVAMPFGKLMAWGLEQSVMKRGLAGSAGLILAVSTAAVVLSLVPGALLIAYLRAGSRALEKVGMEEPPAPDAETCP